MAHLFDENKGKQDFEALITPKLDALKTTFQGYVNSIYDALVGKGKTPTAKTPAAISTAITNIFDDVYTKFVNQGTTPSAKTVSGMSNAVDTLATNKYNAGVSATKKGNAGQGDVKSGKTFTNSSGVNIAGTFAAQEKTVTSSLNIQTVTPDSGKYLSKVTVNAMSLLCQRMLNSYFTSGANEEEERTFNFNTTAIGRTVFIITIGDMSSSPTLTINSGATLLGEDRDGGKPHLKNGNEPFLYTKSILIKLTSSTLKLKVQKCNLLLFTAIN